MNVVNIFNRVTNWQSFTDVPATWMAAGDGVSVAADSAYYTMSLD